jgi:hypothetical protein
LQSLQKLCRALQIWLLWWHNLPCKCHTDLSI